MRASRRRGPAGGVVCGGGGAGGSEQQGQGPQVAPAEGVDLRKRGQEQGAPLHTSMCYYHAKFGEHAKFLEEGCVWQES
jgi:hypothetical protein